MASSLTEQDWQVRLHVYQVFVQRGSPPTTTEAAAALGLSDADMRAVYQRLHDGHAFFLQPGTTDIRMANPLSAIPTPYRVSVNGRMLYANCAWDSLGIPAMLASDATIEAVYTSASGDTPARYVIVDGALQGDDGLVHYPLPFRHWYDDLIHT